MWGQFKTTQGLGVNLREGERKEPPFRSPQLAAISYLRPHGTPPPPPPEMLKKIIRGKPLRLKKIKIRRGGALKMCKIYLTRGDPHNCGNEVDEICFSYF